MVHSRTIETYGRGSYNRNIYGRGSHNRNIWPSAHNRNIWSYNSQAAPSRLADSFVFQRPVYPLLTFISPFLVTSYFPAQLLQILGDGCIGHPPPQIFSSTF